MGCRAVVLVHGRDVPLDRGNVIGPDPPHDPTASILVDAQRTKGLEVGVTGYVTRAWSVAGGYAYQDGEITRSISASAQAERPWHNCPSIISLGNKDPILHAAARRWTGSHLPRRRIHIDGQPGGPSQLDPPRRRAGPQRDHDAQSADDIENLFDENYYLYAHSNTNITPGSPRAVRFALTTRF